MAALQYSTSVTSKPDRPILPRSSRRQENGWDSTMFSTNLVAFHVPFDNSARWTHVPVIHFNIDEGKTMVIWRQFWLDRAETAFVTLPNGRKYLVLVPYDRTAYQVSNAIEERLGFRWHGEILVFACGVNNGLLVNMRTWQDDRIRAWDVVRRYIVGDIDGNTETSESEAMSDVSASDVDIDVDLPYQLDPDDSDDYNGTDDSDGEWMADE